MNPVERNDELNDLLIRLARCLLQYVEDASPWTAWGDSTEVRGKVYELIARQQRDVEALAKLLSERDWPIESGTFPERFTDYHYVALDYLLGHMVQDQRELVAEVDQSIASFHGDEAALSLVKRIAENQRGILAELEALGKSPTTSKAA